MARRLTLLKIGGSVATDKSRTDFAPRTELLEAIFAAIHTYRQENPDERLVVVHGGGGEVHALAHQHDLGSGVQGDQVRLLGACETKVAVERLNHAVVQAAVTAGMPAIPVMTSDVFLQQAGQSAQCRAEVLMQYLESGVVPVLGGDMVPDTDWGLSICSGDTIMSALAAELSPDLVAYATDVAGVYTDNPNSNPAAELLSDISISNLESVTLTGSTHVDMTDGLRGKVASCAEALSAESVAEVHMFDGQQPDNYKKILTGESFPHTIIQS